MSLPVRLGLVLSTSLASLLGCATDPDPGDPVARRGTTATAAAAIPLTPAEVRVEQIYRERDGGRPSATGALVLDPAAIAERTGVSTGFVSARVGDRWLAFNIPVTTTPEASYPPVVAKRRLPAPRFVPPTRATIHLGTLDALSRFDAQVVFTTAPLTRGDLGAYASQPLQAFLVTPFEADDDLGILPTTIPPGGLPPAPTGPGSVDAPDGPLTPPDLQLPGPLADHWQILLPHDENVNAAKNQCANAAIANGLAYLGNTFGIYVPHGNVRGWGGGITLPGQLDLYSQREVVDRCHGAGTETCRDDDAGGILDALYYYMEAHDGLDAFTLRHQGGADTAYPAACPTLPQDGPVSQREGTEITFDWLCGRIADGDAVILVKYRYEYVDVEGPDYVGNQEPVSAHMVRVYACGETAGQKFIRVLHDAQQDKMTGDPEVCTVREGLSWEYWPVVDNDYDGKLNVKDDNLQELEFAWAIAAS